MDKYNREKYRQLGMPSGTASNRLRKTILFHLIKLQGLDSCYQCGKTIASEKQLSIEHKIPWLDSKDPVGLFFDIDNIAFSHLTCNIGSARKINKGKITISHGTRSMYCFHKCRCDLCKQAEREYRRERRSRNLT